MTSTNIPLFIPKLPCAEDLHPWLKQIDNNRYYSNRGPLVQEYERQVLNHLDISTGNWQAITCSTGTKAIELALRALNLPAKANVLVPAYTFIATGLAVLNAGLTPVFADIDMTCLTLHPEQIAPYIQAHDIAAVVPVATFGFAIDSGAWREFHERYGLPVVVDAAAAIANQTLLPGLHYCFSLHASKAFGVGEGGLVVTANAVLAETIKCLTNFGLNNDISVGGDNAKMSEYHAAVGLAQLSTWQAYTEHLQTLRARYIQTLKEVRVLGENRPNCSHHLIIRCEDAESLARHLQIMGIASRRYYVPLLPEHPVFKSFETLTLSTSQHLAKTTLALPFFADLSLEDMRHITDTLAQEVENRATVCE